MIKSTPRSLKAGKKPPNASKSHVRRRMVRQPDYKKPGHKKGKPRH